MQNFLELYFVEQDNDWDKNNMMLNKKLYFKDSLHLVKAGTEKFAKSICLFLKTSFTESRHSSLLSSFSCSPAPLLVITIIIIIILTIIISINTGPPSTLLLPSTLAVSSLKSLKTPQLASLAMLESMSSSISPTSSLSPPPSRSLL